MTLTKEQWRGFRHKINDLDFFKMCLSSFQRPLHCSSAKYIPLYIYLFNWKIGMVDMPEKDHIIGQVLSAYNY